MYRLTNLETEKIGNVLWRVIRPLLFESTIVGSIKVPVNFYTDGASCPKILWALCAPMSGPQVEAAILHDWLYSKDSGPGLTRKQADQIFYDTMITGGTAKWRAKTIYWGVRAGGSGSWKKGHSIDKLMEK